MATGKWALAARVDATPKSDMVSANPMARADSMAGASTGSTTWAVRQRLAPWTRAASSSSDPRFASATETAM